MFISEGLKGSKRNYWLAFQALIGKFDLMDF